MAEAENKNVVQILLVEDDQDDVFLMKNLLKKSSSEDRPFLVDHADRLDQCEEMLNQKNYDMVLLDLSLPDAQGLDTLTQVRSKAPGIPIVVCSGLSDEDVATEAISKGAQDYLIKGRIDEALLRRVIRYAMERRKLEILREEFVSTVVHELRSPLLVSIEATAQTLEGILGEITEDQRQFLTLSHDSMKRLSRMIDDLLDMTKMELGKVQLFKEEFDFIEIVKHTGASFQQLAVNKGLALESELSVESLTVNGDKDKLTQVLINLVNNAIKFTEQGSIRMSVQDQGDTVLCTVADTGKGIAAEDVDKLFDKFKQFGKKQENGQKGTGLGLAITRGIVLAHEGKIWVESELGQGSKFVFEIPKQAQ